ncbi:6-bladed beta-propeller [Pedobacter heparinus]|uniref:6-bladed beta-propeller n=1 Tax=Pedobacter heparinus (strain ATCC 13125 / DSM 2366 / CIP 104194 / JCM 7457 / NBRC 12017 / NCIMB 9290 / NRRL B-14731 / HIM 762-3) TaxID=485917 RepID=C6XWN6_PEDHD|nr:6-bladed beta-propeller [Pedobacter heparinus]ACU06325.1 hypothetical protein Phep_4134 [Pedobacter heparinus DSM 2366]
MEMRFSLEFSRIIIICFLQFFIIGCFSGANNKSVSPTLSLQYDDKAHHIVKKSLFKNGKVNIDLSEEGKKLKITEILGSYKYVILETLPESLLGSISKVLLKDRRIFVLDYKMSKAVFVFDINGKFIYKVAPKKSDLYMPLDICLVEKNLYILSEGTVSKYSVENGELIETFNLPFKAISFAPVESKNETFNFFVNKNANTGIGLNLDFEFFTLDLNKRKILKEQIRSTNRDAATFALFNFFYRDKETFFTKTNVDTVFEVKTDSIVPILNIKFEKSKAVKSASNSLLCNFMATPKFYYCSRVTEGKLYHIYINRQNNRFVKVKLIIDNRFLGSFNSTPVGASGEDFIFLIDPAALKYNLAKHKDKGDSLSITKLFKDACGLESEVKRTDNPILVFAKPNFYE